MLVNLNHREAFCPSSVYSLDLIFFHINEEMCISEINYFLLFSDVLFWFFLNTNRIWFIYKKVIEKNLFLIKIVKKKSSLMVLNANVFYQRFLFKAYKFEHKKYRRDRGYFGIFSFLSWTLSFFFCISRPLRALMAQRAAVAFWKLTKPKHLLRPVCLSINTLTEMICPKSLNNLNKSSSL